MRRTWKSWRSSTASASSRRRKRCATSTDAGSDDLTVDLAPEKQVAIAWTPSGVRRSLATFLALDHRLARIVSLATEPMLAQIRLAWWRDELAKPIGQRPVGDAVLDAVGTCWNGQEALLSKLVDAWELLLAEPPLSPDNARKFVRDRAAPIAGLVQGSGSSVADRARQAGELWAAVDAANHSSNKEERACFRQLVERPLQIDLPRQLRGMAVLSGLARRALLRNEPALMQGRGGALAALRLGIFGR